MAALLRRAEEGGSWLVRVSLAGTGEWIKRLGRLEAGLSAPGLTPADIDAALEESDLDVFGQAVDPEKPAFTRRSVEG